MSPPPPILSAAPATHRIALAGNPNVGKTALFNQLTGLRQKVGNYPGVTVERKVGRMKLPDGSHANVVDVPGTYSLNPRSLDEDIALAVLIGTVPGEPPPDVIVCVVDASNLERNLYLVSQVMDLGRPMVVALNMIDAAERKGHRVDVAALQSELGVPVVPIVARRGRGIAELRQHLVQLPPPPPARRWRLPAAFETELEHLVTHWENTAGIPSAPSDVISRSGLALRALTNQTDDHRLPDGIASQLADARRRLKGSGIYYEQVEVISRYEWITPLARRVVDIEDTPRRDISDRLDAVLTHRFAGPVIFLLVLATIFQAVFSWAAPVMNGLDSGVGKLGYAVYTVLPDSLLRDLIVDGIIAGVGAVVIFLPQILLIFFFLGLLEDSGYMARAAFIMDRMMRRLGLSGRSVVPLLSSYACAIPGIMATRTMDDERDRLVTILVSPFMTCSARLPVYALLIAAFIPAGHGFPGPQSLTLLALYLMGTLTALGVAWVLKRKVVKGDASMFVMELPPYRRPRLRDTLWRMVERARLFLSRAGTIILAVSIVLWALASFPRLPADPNLSPDKAAHAQLSQSVMGQAGHAIEPVMRPLGFDWKISVAVLSSLAAREVVVSALGTMYSVGDAEENDATLRTRMLADIDPTTGRPVWTPLVGLSLMVFFVLACQCMSTLAIVKRETNSWRWPAFMFGYMTVLAYVAAFAVYQGGRLLGYS